MKRFLVLGFVLSAVAVVVTGSLLANEAWDRLRSRPVDMTQVKQRMGIQAPAPLIAFVKRDAIAYHAHVVLAASLARAHGSPEAIGVQWVKAAAHARSATELERVSRGLLRSQAESADPAAFQATLCGFVEGGYWTGLQREAFAAADLRCSLVRRR